MAKQPDTHPETIQQDDFVEYEHDHLDDDDLKLMLDRRFDGLDWALTFGAVAVVAAIGAGIWWAFS